MKITKNEWRANLLLLITAGIWGFGFVAQRYGAMLVPPFFFNALRFGIGAISIIPLLQWKKHTEQNFQYTENSFGEKKEILKGGILAGVAIYFAAWLQQAGLEYTTPGKAAFLTALYIVLVPVLSTFLKQKIKKVTWLAVALAVIGLYFLCITGEFKISKGDLYEIAGALFWALQILVIDYFIKKVDSIPLAFAQFVTCTVLCMFTAIIAETTSLEAIEKAIIPILYGGLGSVGIAYTLQTVAQKDAKPSHAALILSSEILFGVLGGIIFFQENLGARGYIGCLFMIIGILISILAGTHLNNVGDENETNDTSVYIDR